jgi:hypothetical protein
MELVNTSLHARRITPINPNLHITPFSDAYLALQPHDGRYLAWQDVAETWCENFEVPSGEQAVFQC